MKKKIVSKKRNVKKKIKKISSPEQWGKEFEKLGRRRPIKFNFLRRGVSGDPFSLVGNEETPVLMKPIPFEKSYMASVLGIRTDIDPLALIDNTPVLSGNTRGELGAAPAHYANGKYTPWEIVDDWKLDYYCGNALKYVCRHKHKGKPVEDIQKAIDCLIKYKTNLEKENV